MIFGGEVGECEIKCLYLQKNILYYETNNIRRASII